MNGSPDLSGRTTTQNPQRESDEAFLPGKGSYGSGRESLVCSSDSGVTLTPRN